MLAIPQYVSYPSVFDRNQKGSSVQNINNKISVPFFKIYSIQLVVYQNFLPYKFGYYLLFCRSTQQQLKLYVEGELMGPVPQACF